MKTVATITCFFIAITIASGNQIAESQQQWFARYKKQKNAPNPSEMLINTDREPDLKEGFISLYNGGNLDGWTSIGGSNTFEAKDAIIVGTLVKDTDGSTFLSTTKSDYADFIFTAEIKWAVDGNTGIMFRAQVKDGNVVFGPQVEMENESKQRFWSGGIYGQSCGGWSYPLWLESHEKARNAIDRKGWNRVTIEAVGDTVKTWVNGVPAANWKTEEYKQGFFGLQVHPGRSGTIHFRNIKVKEL
ncbi:3-keto-disaccharide hydrolase [Pontiella sulfatireligans]|uniref:3-keto-alpha-glucoside-1,2-lyase/3-keto-2-hydroxy-glucal hydratase domain-containing protein n=1 Tax=Pontiella sulfatireligans TaxID=2750658 RepID=A0A6C2UF82_9BACT|nr:DUF1080 domain-containing protein [Pontiella sulfatireligans]VGO18579.1 hypothetical protein SCARR_00632 [Pontiella sulfatireligans]